MLESLAAQPNELERADFAIPILDRSAGGRLRDAAMSPLLLQALHRTGSSRRLSRSVSVLALGLAVFCFSNCTDSGAFGLKTSLPDGRAQEQRTITLANYYEFNPSHTSPRYHLPAGRYVATYEDANGTYFPAPGGKDSREKDRWHF